MIDQTISHYRIVEKLGGGGMGVVYKAEEAATLVVLSKAVDAALAAAETARTNERFTGPDSITQ